MEKTFIKMIFDSGVEIKIVWKISTLPFKVPCRWRIDLSRVITDAKKSINFNLFLITWNSLKDDKNDN